MTSSLAHGFRLGYRSDIEGLRAVAILLVVAAHAQCAHLAGGFVGVDVFFVLSGYLITGLLVQEIDSTGRLDFALFYARRLRRLLPGLLLMLLCASVLGRLLLAPGQQTDQAEAAAGAALWLSNFVFAFGNFDYFGASADTNLFLHTWSLGVEEQFYLVWPLLVVLAVGARRGDQRRFGKALALMTLVLALSLALCAAWMRQQPLFAFYMMPARAWQFALGAIVFLSFGSPDFSTAVPMGAKDRLGAALLRAGGWIGLVAILATAVIVDNQTPYPGLWALCPSLGAAAVLSSGARAPTSAVGKLLSLQPLQAIGRVSYAWYLWHWPILLLGATILDTHSPFNRFVLVAVSFFVGVIAYHGFERPLRRNPALMRKPGRAIAAAIALMILGNALALRWHNAARDHMASPEQQRYEQARMDGPIIYFQGCDEWYFSDEVKLCAFGDPNATHTAMAIGDSVALQWFPAYAKLYDIPGWRLLVATKSSCPMVDAPFYYARIGREFAECDRWRSALLAQIAKIKPDVVVFGSTYTSAFTPEQWTQGTTRILDALAPASGHVYIMRSTPVLPFDGPSCLEPRSWLYRMLSPRAACTAAAHNDRSDSVYRWLEAVAGHFANVSMIDMTDAICPGGTCSAQRDGTIVFRDSQHLTANYARSLAPALQARMRASTPTPPPTAIPAQPGAQ